VTTLLRNGRIHSPTHPDATAMAVHGDIVAWLGADDVGSTLYPDAEVIDLGGAFVAPAFVDCHVHITATGLSMVGLDLRGADSRSDLLHRLSTYAAEHPDAVIWGHGWDQTGWPEETVPTTAEIDAVTGRRPVYLSRIDVHSALASTALRQRCDIPVEQHPLTAAEHHRARAAARELLSPAQRGAARMAALDAFAANGVVAVHECAGPDIGGIDDWRELSALQHGVKVTGYWGEAVCTAAQARDLIAATGAAGLAGDLFVDGALGSHTAWLSQPYTDAPGCTGNTYLEPEQITAHVSACTEAGVPAGFHVIGDAAVSAVVDAFATVVDRYGTAAVARCGHRLEHLEMPTIRHAEQLGSWGVIASMQPNFDALWGGRDGMYAQRLGIERAATLNPLALLASHGVPLAFGSDSPVTGIDPWQTVRAAAAHRTPGSAISPRAAFAAATRGAWRAGGVRDGVTGTLVPGAPASFAVWHTDTLEVSAPADRVARWSTDPRSRVPALPRLGPGDPAPVCRATVHRGAVIFGALDG